MKNLLIKAVLGAALVFGVAGCSNTYKYGATFTSGLTASGTKSAGTSAFVPRAAKSSSWPKPVYRGKKPYFIEFRARSAYTYGHLSVVFGLRNKKGGIPIDSKGELIPSMVEISGLHPASNSPVPFFVGHVVPVPAETGWSDGDSEEAYVTARYRINLTKREFDNVVRIVHKHKTTGSAFWHGAVYACVQYVRHIARDMGLTVPRTTHLPAGFVNKLKALNAG